MGKQASLFEDIFNSTIQDINSPFEQKPIPLPPKKPEINPEDHQKDLNVERSRRVKPLLLLVEDERMTQAFIESLLENYCDVIFANTIKEGRALYYKIRPNIVFMDILLPDGDGQELAQEILKSDPSGYIVMVSANISNEIKMQCISLGIKGFVHKPVTQDKQRLMQQIFDYNNYRKILG